MWKSSVSKIGTVLPHILKYLLDLYEVKISYRKFSIKPILSRFNRSAHPFVAGNELPFKTDVVLKRMNGQRGLNPYQYLKFRHFRRAAA